MWRKSTWSADNGCAEVSLPQWRRCSVQNDCVEVARDDDGDVLVRDSKDPDGPVLRFTPPEWDAFVAGVKDGEFDQEVTGG